MPALVEPHSAFPLASLDPEALARLRRIGGDLLLGRMADAFLSHVPQRLETARAALGAGDLELAGRACHAVKSSAAQLGAHALVAACADGEAAADAHDRPPLAAALARAAALLCGVRAELETLRAMQAEAPHA